MRDHACIDNNHEFDSDDTTVISIALSSSSLENVRYNQPGVTLIYSQTLTLQGSHIDNFSFST